MEGERSASIAIGVDIGGTKLAAGLVGGDGSVVERVRRDTPADDPEEITSAVVEAARELAAPHGVTGCPLGVGGAGLIDLAGVVRYAPNVAWEDYPLRDRLAGSLDGLVTVDNDANTAAWGEFRVGAGAAVGSDMVMITVGTGVGGGVVVGGRLLRGATGLAGEVGHLVVAEGGPACPCGNRGCLEALCSGTAIGKAAEHRLELGEVPPDSMLGPGRDLSGKAVTVAAHAGDPTARALLAEAGFWLGVGIASLVNALDPELVVVGGGAMQAGELLLEPARSALAERIIGRGHRSAPPVVAAQLADDAGLVGAALLAMDEAAG